MSGVRAGRLWLLPLLGFAAATGAWEWAVARGAVTPLLFPAPSAIAARLLGMVQAGELQPQLEATLTRLGAGFVLGGLPGLGLGLLMGWSRRARGILDPLVAALHPVPKVALFPLVMLVFGLGESSRLVVVGLAAFFPMLLNAMAGVRQIPAVCFEAARSFGASRARIFWRVVLPGSLPLVATGVRLALNAALVLSIVVEMASSRLGLGSMIWSAWQTLRTEDLYASVAVIAACGIALSLGVQGLARKAIPWQVDPTLVGGRR